MTIELDKSYDHRKVEPKWYPFWEERRLFRAQDNRDKPPFCLVIPPPNVTGALHMGHALTYAIQDCIIRWKRMCGFNTLWLPGCDHAGIATQMLVERHLAESEGTTRDQLGREKFIAKVWEWKGKYHARITEQSRRMGISVDWERERFTLDEGLSRAVRDAFVTLYEQGLVYRARKMVNWSPAIRTVLSDLEVEHKEVKGHFWHLAYPVVGQPGRTIVVATTRPETMLGDTAVAVHSTDARYKDLVGRQVELPLTGRTIPVIADDLLADPDKGTGAVKVTPAHDPNDFECGLRNKLEFVDIFDDVARLNHRVPEKYRGMDRFVARQVVVEDLKAAGLLLKVEELTHMVGHCQRSGVPVEPKVSWQWFVTMGPADDPDSIAGAAIRAVEEARIRFVPPHWAEEYFRWLTNIRDWCVSRQLWWGHRIPAWHCNACGQAIVARTDPDRCRYCGSAELHQDEDVLDTWFSSALWPFSTLGWPEKTPALATFYPNAIMETGFDIIFFWVARMIMMGIRLAGDIPFSEVYLHAMVRDAHGQKMSKTKGNVVDPLDVCNEHGADALRFTLLALTVQGRDVKLSMERVEGYRAFMNKLWNATRFLFMNLPDGDYPHPRDVKEKLSPQDRWILTRLQQVTDEAWAALAEYRFNDYAGGLYHFAWHEFCDWYVELAKASLYGEDEESKRVTRSVLLHVLKTVLELLHPAIPYLTEELWQRLPNHRGESIVVAAYPQADPALRFPEEAARFAPVMETIAAIRSVRTLNHVPPSAQVNVVLRPSGDAVAQTLQWGRDLLARLARTGGVIVDVDARRPKASGAAVTSSATVFVELAGVIDLEAERKRLDKELDKLRQKADSIAKKLANPTFLERAPMEVIEEQEAMREELLGRIAGIEEHLKSIADA